jgi:hypothetical protein
VVFPQVLGLCDAECDDQVGRRPWLFLLHIREGEARKQTFVSEDILVLPQSYQAHAGNHQELGKDRFLKKYFQFTSHVEFT